AVDKAIAEARVLKGPAVRAALRATPETADVVGRLATAEHMLCPAQQLASEVARTGPKVWMYHFTRIREGDIAAQFRAYHGAELPYVFGTHDAWLPTAAADRRLSLEMMRAWVRFAATGSPQGPTGPRWPAFGSGDGARVLRLDAAMTLVDPPEPVLCRLYREGTTGQDALASPSQN
ncbi:MAG: hypothetical protein EBS39_10945, partial [Gammaproteobacteria bacterium]|nr:hypothetical protein [Gammaproteobacteria bacterium]